MSAGVLEMALPDRGLSASLLAAIEWQHLPELWVIALIVVPAIAGFAALFYWRERLAAGDRSRWLLAGLREEAAQRPADGSLWLLPRAVG